MNDPRLDPLIQTAMSRLMASMAQAIDKTGTQLGMLALASSTNAQRQTLMDAEYELQRRGPAVAQAFARELAQGVARDLQKHTRQGDVYADTDWTALRLVDDDEIEQTVSSAKLTRLLEVDCESELQELRGYFATLQGGDGDDEVFPLRPAIVARSLLSALRDCSQDVSVRQQVARVLALHTSAALRDAYQQLIFGCKDMRVTPAPLAVRRPRDTGPGRSGWDDSRNGSTTPSAPGALSPNGSGGDAGPGRGEAEELSKLFCIPCPAPLQLHAQGDVVATSASGGSPPTSDAGGHGETSGGGGATAGSAASAVAGGDLLGLMRRLQGMASLTSPPAFTASGHDAPPAALAPMNVIRAHRDELVEASGGASLDQMVIDIVATLFDHVLSDPKVPPQMARQIARLQLPVLRVALRDATFFHARRHPVRRFINRMATLASAFDDLDEGAGRACLDTVSRLVHEIVEGDFDRLDLYEQQLGELERLIAEQTAREAEEHAAVTALLSGRESDLRVQQRYMQLVTRELADIDEAPNFIKTFLAQIWTQVLVMSATRHGADSDIHQRHKRAGHQLVLSVQPKGHPSLRSDFLRQLPQLMKDLNEGLDMIQWAAEAKQAFFAQLLPLHAEALKAAPPHELTLRLLEQRLRKVEQIAIPSREDAANDPLPSPSEPGALPLAAHLTPQEAREAGWVSEQQVHTDGASLDIDLSGAGEDADLSGPDIDIILDSPAPPAAGPSLVNFIQAGAAYRMLLRGQWRKVRLTWVSEGRTFFIFTHGHQAAKETISLTARTLGQMCASGRFKAFEQAQLLERATIRARRQLAALNAQRKVAA